MTAFDPYRKWLGIPSEEQPPSYYRLLGIPEFETDLDVIESAADRQMIYLRTFQTGPNSELAEGLLNEVSLARVCLLQPAEKAKYDQQLKAKYDQQLQADQVPVPPPMVEGSPPMVEGPPLGSEVSLPGPTEEGVSVEVKPGLEKVASRSARAGRRRSRRRSVKPLWQQPMVHVLGIVCLGLLLLILANLGGSGKRASVDPRNTRPDKNSRLENPDSGSGDGSQDEGDSADGMPSEKEASSTGDAGEGETGPDKKPEPEESKPEPEESLTPDTNPQDLPGIDRVVVPQPLPDKAEVEKQRNEVVEAYSDRVDEARKLVEDKKEEKVLRNLAKEILDNVPRGNAGDLARRYAVYEYLFGQGKKSGDSTLTLELISKWEKEFLIDAWQYRHDALKLWTKNKLDTKAHRKLIKIIVEQAEAATREITPQRHHAELTEKLYMLAYKEYDRLFDRLVTKPETRPAAKRVADQKKKVLEAKKQITALLAALAELKEDSADEQCSVTDKQAESLSRANQVVGTFFAFVCRDWKIALPYLAKAEDEEFREAAKLDLTNAIAVAGQFKIGAAWLTIGKEQSQAREFDWVKEQARSALYQRAAFWYQKVLKQDGGSYKNRIAVGMPDVPAALRGEPLPANGFFKRDAARKFQEAWAYYLDLPVKIYNTSGMIFVLIPPGKFTMGTLIDASDKRGSADFSQVKTINEPFYIGQYEVTQGQYADLELTDYSKFKGPGLPVDYMSCSYAERSCRNLTGKAANEGKALTYRLPTELEWEYAARAGQESDWAPASSFRNYQASTWYKANSLGHTWEVGKKAPNQWELYDMQGNVSEWCQGQVARGTHYATGFGRVSYRDPSSNREGTGFRVVLEIPPNDLQKAAKRREMVSTPPLEAAAERDFFTRPEDE